MTHVIGPDPRFTQPVTQHLVTSLFILPRQVPPRLAKHSPDQPVLRTGRSIHSSYRQNSYALDPVHAALRPMRVDLRMLPLLISIYVSLLSLVFKPLYFVYISSVQISTRTPSLVFFSSPCLIRLSELRSSYQTCTTQTRVFLVDIRAHLTLPLRARLFKADPRNQGSTQGTNLLNAGSPIPDLRHSSSPGPLHPSPQPSDSRTTA